MESTDGSGSDSDICDHIHSHEFRRVELTPERAVDRLDCRECGEVWFFEREPTLAECLELLRRSLQSIADELVQDCKRL